MRLPTLLALVVLALLAPAAARASVGGAAAPSDPGAGGAEFGTPVGRPSAARPVATVFSVAPRTVTEGTAPAVALRVTQRGVRAVRARVVLRPVGSRGAVVALDLGRVRVGRLVHPAWPSSVATPAAGRYDVLLHVTGPAGATLRRPKTAPGRATLVVRPAPVAPAPAPAPSPAPVVTIPVASTPPVADPPPTTAGVFPVAGAHAFGDGFGAGRSGHVHQGQDVLADEGTPVVAPVAGTIVARDDQPAAAGYYLTLDAADGRSLFFAHCQADSFAVALGQPVTPGQPLCRVGHTGDATGPHLHFEIWLGGWRRDAASHPIDPLAQLLAWGG